MSGPRRAEERLRRLLVMLPWLMEAGRRDESVPLAEVARRFDMPEAQVAKELELVAMCGLPPYVDEMIDVFIDDGMVFVGVPRLFTRPLRLTAPEAFSLLAAARAAMELPGADPSGPLARGLAKLAAALGAVGIDTPSAAGSDDTAGVVIDLSRPALADDITDAVPEGRELAIRYYSPGSDSVGERTIVPRHVFVEQGNWYVRALDGRSGELRTFRIDRIDEATPTGRVDPPGDDPVEATPFFSDADVPRATLRLAPPAQWILERYPVDEVVDTTVAGATPGSVDVTLPVTSPRWIARLLVRLGPDAELVDPADLAGEANAMARRMLAGYR